MGKTALPLVLHIGSGFAEKLTAAETEALELAVGTVRKSATSWTHDISDIIEGAVDAEAALIERGVPATHRVGIRYVCRHRGPSSSSYRHTVIASEYVLVRRRDCWRLENYERVEAWPGDREKRSFEAGEKVRECLIKHALAGFTFVDDETPSIEDTLGYQSKPYGFGEFRSDFARAAKGLNSNKLEPAAA